MCKRSTSVAVIAWWLGSLRNLRSYPLFVGMWSVLVFLAMILFSPITMPECTLHSRCGTWFKNSVGKCWTVPLQLNFGTQQFLSVVYLKGPLVGTSFHLWCRCQMCCCHVADTTGTYVLCIWVGQTYHMLWYMPQPLRGLCRKIVCQWCVHCVLSVSSIKIVPLVYRYSKLTW